MAMWNKSGLNILIIQFNSEVTPSKNDPQRTIIFDRDGTLNVDFGYTHKIEDFRWEKNIDLVLERLSGKDIRVLVVTNQSGISRGYYGYDDVFRFNQHIVNEAQKFGVDISAFAICPHMPDSKNLATCSCRKPRTAMLDFFVKFYSLDLDYLKIFGNSEVDLFLNSEYENYSSLISIDKHEILEWIDGY